MITSCERLFLIPVQAIKNARSPTQISRQEESKTGDSADEGGGEQPRMRVMRHTLEVRQTHEVAKAVGEEWSDQLTGAQEQIGRVGAEEACIAELYPYHRPREPREPMV